jgi:hypothetical protein
MAFVLVGIASFDMQAEAHEQLSYAWDQGINFMDTAEVGRSTWGTGVPSARVVGLTVLQLHGHIGEGGSCDRAVKVSGPGHQGLGSLLCHHSWV